MNSQVLMTMRMQSAQLTESSLSGKKEEESECLKRMLCTMGVARSGMEISGESYVFPKISLGRAIEEFKMILESMASDVSRSEHLAAEKFPNIYQTLGR